MYLCTVDLRTVPLTYPMFRVSDGTYSSNSQPFTVIVSDVNDNGPEFVMSLFEANINENKALGTAEKLY